MKKKSRNCFPLGKIPLKDLPQVEYMLNVIYRRNSSNPIQKYVTDRTVLRGFLQSVDIKKLSENIRKLFKGSSIYRSF